MSPMKEVREEAKRILDGGDPAGALEVLQDALEGLEAGGGYDPMAKWALLDEMVLCHKALGNEDAAKKVRAEQARVSREIDSKRATGEIRSKHILTNRKKDLPSKERRHVKPEQD